MGDAHVDVPDITPVLTPNQMVKAALFRRFLQLTRGIPDEWSDATDNGNGETFWQNKRTGRIFSLRF